MRKIIKYIYIYLMRGGRPAAGKSLNIRIKYIYIYIYNSISEKSEFFGNGSLVI